MLATRRIYLETLADDYRVGLEIILMLADVLGEDEDHDGLINAIEDYKTEMDFHSN